jgi:hypothetical protein
MGGSDAVNEGLMVDKEVPMALLGTMVSPGRTVLGGIGYAQPDNSAKQIREATNM